MIATLAVLTVAAMLTGRPGTTVADTAVCPVDYGCADIPGNVIHMRPYLADQLGRLDEIQPYQSALALLVFCHEARHVRGTDPRELALSILPTVPHPQADERIAERWAVAHVYVVARLLGASPERALAIKRWVPWWNARVGT